MSTRLAGWVLGAALVVIAVMFGVSLWRLTSSSDVASVVVAVVAAIGTLVVAFFGIHVADAGRQAAERGRQAADSERRRAEELHLFEQRRVRRLAATTDPRERSAILNEDPPEALPGPS